MVAVGAAAGGKGCATRTAGFAKGYAKTADPMVGGLA
jgi:hypothetical protein